MHATAPVPAWHTIAILLARLIFAAVFLMATVFKFAGMADTADLYRSGRIPVPALSRLGCRVLRSSCW